ncbi:MAG: hypothetical protein H6R26_782, partial [Proteobacteria bacterium]|nr:hypothetical protein [Pseudomonadota bacterium]
VVELDGRSHHRGEQDAAVRGKLMGHEQGYRDDWNNRDL